MPLAKPKTNDALQSRADHGKAVSTGKLEPLRFYLIHRFSDVLFCVPQNYSVLHRLAAVWLSRVPRIWLTSSGDLQLIILGFNNNSRGSVVC